MLAHQEGTGKPQKQGRAGHTGSRQPSREERKARYRRLDLGMEAGAIDRASKGCKERAVLDLLRSWETGCGQGVENHS